MMDFNNNDKELEQDVSLFLKSHKIQFKVSQEEEWQHLQSKMEHTAFYHQTVFRYAAGIALIISLALSARFYSQTVTCHKGQHLASVLPDGSTVQLNADSELSYYPIWWYIKREVKLKGEAFFKVKKGERFTVYSSQGHTSVLGTSFNVHARDKNYQVACVTGKVRVNTIDKEFILTPGKTVLAKIDQAAANTSIEDQMRFIAWKSQQLVFIGQPLDEVFKALERQYNVSIEYDASEQHLFSGNLELKKGLSTNLLLVCKPFFMQSEKVDANTVKISKRK